MVTDDPATTRVWDPSRRTEIDPVANRTYAIPSRTTATAATLTAYSSAIPSVRPATQVRTPATPSRTPRCVTTSASPTAQRHL